MNRVKIGKQHVRQRQVFAGAFCTVIAPWSRHVLRRREPANKLDALLVATTGIKHK